MQFYEGDEYLCQSVAEFVGAGLRGGEPVIVIATGEHLAALRKLLDAAGFDVQRDMEDGHIALLDAEPTLASLMANGQPSWDLFSSHIGGAIRKMRAGHGERAVRAYGEMVDILWRRGDAPNAIILEEMWNELGKREEFALLCGYSLDNFRHQEDITGLRRVCEVHSHVQPAEAFTELDSESARLREVVLLQQRARALEAEVQRRSQLETELRQQRVELQQREQELKELVCELETANRTKDEFLATVSHELRTPLNAILGWARMLRSGGLPPEKRDKALDTIERNANAQAHLIEDLLDVSRIISGKLRLDLDAVDLSLVVESAIEAVRPAAQAKGVTIRQLMEPCVGPTLADAGRLQQVVWNLLTNAVKFTPKGGAVQIAVRKRESSLEIVVADTGQGIAREFLPKVFERFRQADATMSRKHGGLGLGLAIVRHLVELHGGTVEVDSAGLGRGATFTILLPTSPLRSASPERPPALRMSATPAFERPHVLEGLKILVLDDEPDARDLLFEMLTSYKAEVARAASGGEALRLLQELRPDIVISDIGMPDEDGYAFIAKLRGFPESMGGRTPAVALTAFARFEDRTKALVAGFNMHVPKPVEPAELLAALSRLRQMFPSRRPERSALDALRTEV